MKILISGTELNVKDCFARELASGARFLNITFLQSDIGYDALDAIFAESDGKIILTKDDGNVQIFAGYSFTPEITGKTEEDGTKVFTVVVKCVAEAERQALEAKAQVAALEMMTANQAATIKSLTAELFTQAEVIVAQGETIATQNEQVAALMEASTSQLDAIDSILTEVIPTVVQDAATLAVEQALAAVAESENSNVETENTEEN